ncbi:hypothetical protein [Acidovorax sp.]|uniref:hypothetical protein n=1 Tax=Acidovorax sp. TaxID=1872122 RepID=UPI0025BE98C0|nr:hypothetical protein [Acidovorax sp.]MCI5070139.1 hypothetical protein [Acidovorax sp.]
MIGTQPTGTLPGIVICATSHEGLKVSVDGKPARLAIVDEGGRVLAAGEDVAREAEAVALNNFRNALMGKGFLRSISKRISTA